LAVLASIGTESENAVSAFLYFQCLGGTENGRASCPARNAEYFGVSLGRRVGGGDWNMPAPRLDGAELANKASAPA
jgi:hypothetical protein